MNDATPPIVLAKGSHPGDPCENAERCLFEWYNWLTRHQHTDDRPPGVSPVLHRFGMSLNDALPDDTRQQLVRYLPNGVDRLGGTEGDGKDEVRGYLALDWLVRAYLPAWLDLAGLAGESSALRRLEPIRHMEAASAAGPAVCAASAKANAAWVAAGDAAWVAAGDAAWVAAGDAAWDAARDAAWAAARAAARAAAGAVAVDAAWAKLASTVALLQADAILLYDRMIAGVFDA